jgi:hypothetical protein
VQVFIYAQYGGGHLTSPEVEGHPVLADIGIYITQ